MTGAQPQMWKHPRAESGWAAGCGISRKSFKQIHPSLKRENSQPWTSVGARPRLLSAASPRGPVFTHKEKKGLLSFTWEVPWLRA